MCPVSSVFFFVCCVIVFLVIGREGGTTQLSAKRTIGGVRRLVISYVLNYSPYFLLSSRIRLHYVCVCMCKNYCDVYLNYTEHECVLNILNILTFRRCVCALIETRK